MSDKQREFIKSEVYKGCISAGIPEAAASDQSEAAVVMYGRGQYSGEPFDLIKSQIATAKRINKKIKGRV